MADLKIYTPTEIKDTYWGDVDPAEEWGSCMKLILSRTNISPTACDVLNFVTRSSAAAIRFYISNGLISKEALTDTFFVVVPRGTLTNAAIDKAIAQVRPIGIAIDPDAPEPQLRKLIARHTISYQAIAGEVTYQDYQKSAREKGYTL
jgi:hypothetical protein